MPMTQTYAAFSLLLISHAARLGNEKGWEAVKAQGWRIAGLQAFGSAVYWCLIYGFRYQIVHLLYADRYPQLIPLLPAVAVASILSGAAMGPTIAIRAMRSPISVAAIYFVSSLVSVLIGIPACWAWGVRGAVVALALSSIAAVVTGFHMLTSDKGEQLAAGFRERSEAVLNRLLVAQREEGR
jgi:O-antigen/teichoic acid export membrane protein